MNNKIIIKYLDDYYKIINEKFLENDLFSPKIIEIYQSYVFSIDVNNKKEIKYIRKLNESVKRYFNDREFKKYLVANLKTLRVPKSENSISYIALYIIKMYNDYLDGFTRNIYIPRWI